MVFFPSALLCSKFKVPFLPNLSLILSNRLNACIYVKCYIVNRNKALSLSQAYFSSLASSTSLQNNWLFGRKDKCQFDRTDKRLASRKDKWQFSRKDKWQFGREDMWQFGRKDTVDEPGHHVDVVVMVWNPGQVIRGLVQVGLVLLRQAPVVGPDVSVRSCKAAMLVQNCQVYQY